MTSRAILSRSNIPFPPLENEPYEAERHLALGNLQSAETLARLEYEWYTNDESHTAGIYASRAVFPYLLTGNVRSANKALLIFTTCLSTSTSGQALGMQEVSSTSTDIRVYPSLPLLNFTSLLLLAIQRGSSDLFRQLARHYAPHIRDVGIWDDALAHIGEVYFGIKIPKQANPLMDMVGMLFGGGSGQAGNNNSKSGRNSKAFGKVEAPSQTMDLD